MKRILINLLGAAAVLFFLGTVLPATAADKGKQPTAAADGFSVNLASAGVEIEFPDGSVLSIPGDIEDGSLEGVRASGGMAADLLAEAGAQMELAPMAKLPRAFSLAQNSPNPFNPSTTIAYEVAGSEAVHATLKVFNVRGQLVRTLVNSEKAPGSYVVDWNGRDERGNSLASGIYFYRFRAGDYTSTRKMVMLK